MESANNNKIFTNKDTDEEFVDLAITLHIPKPIKQVLESLCRITDRDINNLTSLLIVDQLNYFENDMGELLTFMKGYSSFCKSLKEGTTLFYRKEDDSEEV